MIISQASARFFFEICGIYWDLCLPFFKFKEKRSLQVEVICDVDFCHGSNPRLVGLVFSECEGNAVHEFSCPGLSDNTITLLVSQLAVQCSAAFQVLKYTLSVVISVKGECMGLYKALGWKCKQLAERSPLYLLLGSSIFNSGCMLCSIWVDGTVY